MVCHAESYTFKNLGIYQGLSCNYVNALEQDKDGFIWVATEEGLNFFDGLRFHATYKNANPEKGLAGNELNCLLDDPNEPVMWIGTQRTGLDAYDYKRQEFRHYRHQEGIPYSLCTDEVTHLSRAENGNIWVSTYWGGIDLLDRKKDKFFHYNTKTVKGLSDNKVWCAYDDGRGHLYVGHVSHGFSIIDIKRRQALNYRHVAGGKNSVSGNEVRCLFLGQKGNVWVGTDKGLDLYNPDTKRFSHFYDEGKLARKIYDIKLMGDGRLWVATEFGGIAILENPNEAVKGEKAIFTYLKTGKGNSGISANSVRCLVEDKFDNIWIGLYDEGLDFLTRRQPLFRQVSYSVFARDNELTTKSVLDVCYDLNGNLYVGTDGDGVNVFNAQGNRVKVLRIGGGEETACRPLTVTTEAEYG